jgi:hypothetical protein
MFFPSLFVAVKQRSLVWLTAGHYLIFPENSRLL